MSGEVDLDGKTIEDVAAAWIAANEADWKAWAAVDRCRLDSRTRPLTIRAATADRLQKDA